MSKNTVNPETLLRTASLVKQRSGDTPGVVGFLIHPDTTTADVTPVKFILESEPVAIRRFYGEFDFTFNTLSEAELFASQDLGRITAMQFKLFTRFMFMQYRTEKYENRKDVFKNDCHQLCHFSGLAFASMIPTVMWDFLSESSTAGEFTDKVCEYAFTTVKYTKTHLNKLIEFLFKKVRGAFHPERLAAFTLGYLFQLNVELNKEGEKRNKSALTAELESIFSMLREWTYFGMSFDEGFVNSVLHSFIHNKGSVVENAHWLQIARIIWLNASVEKRARIPSEIANYEVISGIKVHINNDNLSKKYDSMLKFTFSHGGARSTLSDAITITL